MPAAAFFNPLLIKQAVETSEYELDKPEDMIEEKIEKEIQPMATPG